ncbi:MAG: transaldolase family protein [Arachnia sp.]
MTQSYLAWMAAETPSRWCNDSALTPTILNALGQGAAGVTTNAPLSYEALTCELPDQWLDSTPIDPGLDPDAKVVQRLGQVVRPIARHLEPLHDSSNGAYGYVRSQVQPAISADAYKQLEQGLEIATWGANVMVKIPGTASGMWVLEELAARGIPTTATVCVSAPQIIAAADAYERGVARAIEAGIAPAASTSAFVMGRLQDYMATLNQEQQLGLATEDLAEAALAVARRLVTVMAERPGAPRLMPAAFRAARQVTMLSGAPVEMTIHPKIQAMLAEQDNQAGIVREPGIDQRLDQARIERVAEAIPDFVRAWQPDGLTLDEFDDFGATTMTLAGFDASGWQPLRSL